MKPTEEILDKLRKILALAGDKAAQPGEVEAAMAKARELAIRHNIELGSVKIEGDEKSVGGIEVEKNSTLRIKSKYQQPYHRWIFQIMRNVFDVHVILTCHWTYNGKVISAIHVVGEPTDVAIAIAVFPFLEQTFPAIFNRAVKNRILTTAAADMNGCYGGIYRGIVEANKREEEKLTPKEAQCFALIVRDKEALIEAATKEFFPDMTQGRRSSIQSSLEGRAHGYKEGSKINLRQVGSKQGNGSLKG